MSQDKEAEAIENFKHLRSHEAVLRLGDVLKARVERHRSRLEVENDEHVRGRLKELRDILRLLSE